MGFHVASAKFEYVRMLAGAERENIGDASFMAKPTAGRVAPQPERLNARNAIAQTVGTAKNNRANSQKPAPKAQMGGSLAAAGIKNAPKAKGPISFAGARIVLGNQAKNYGAAAAAQQHA